MWWRHEFQALKKSSFLVITCQIDRKKNNKSTDDILREWNLLARQMADNVHLSTTIKQGMLHARPIVGSPLSPLKALDEEMP